MKAESEICNSFNAHADEYEQYAKIQYEIGERLFDRLHYLKINPRYILDLGCGTGVFSRRLRQHYPKAEIIGLDLAVAMLKKAKEKQCFRKKWLLINGDMNQLPFPSGLFDLIFANQVIHWANSLPHIFGEMNRIMNPNGCFMFSTLGPDTFFELKNSWSHDGYAHTNEFVDMHDIGDALLHARFLDPVVDMEMLGVRYKSLSQLLKALKAQGVRNVNPGRNRGLTGKRSFEKFKQSMLAFKTEAGHYPLSYEVIYGHAWKGMQYQSHKGTETLIPLSSLRKPAAE